MTIKINQIYKTDTGFFLRVKVVRDSGLHTLELIDRNGNVIPDQKNSFGHVNQRSERFCSEETIESYKFIHKSNFNKYSNEKSS
ncbi:hypothetical protein [Flavobacterium hungaricum]|uniref:Uncharacterized protein n=1 Tax=Flavobacterium hungaricum TaxID=2082725 RepID=A0ABR9TSD6_9FLAO|nr:hypothetical protein [Flavobacterium hungaricum]MBE8727947.1 hypothetical protein [Flavobacterium hungaricum]